LSRVQLFREGERAFEQVPLDVSAAIVLPVVIKRTASAIGMMRGRRCVPPEPGRMPSFTSGRPSCAFGAATR
jgi:hypothetical protein